MSTLIEACVAHYKMNDNAATTAVIDSQGNYNNAVAQQNTSVLHTTGKVGGALTFNGTSDYINMGATFQSIFQSDFSISLWFKFTRPRPTSDSYKSDDIFGIYSNVSGFDEVHLNLYNIALLSMGNYYYSSIYFLYSVEGIAKIRSITPLLVNSLWDNVIWHHLVAVAKQNGSSLVLSLYLDNTLLKSQTFTNTIMSNYTNASDNCLVGQCSVHGSVPNPYYYFQGEIDIVDIFNRVLTTDEIATLWNGGAGRETLAPNVISNAIISNAVIN